MKTDNELIAEFMEQGPWHKSQYETDWSCLMPVVEKIEDECGLNVVIENAVVTVEGSLINEKGIDVAYYVKQIPYERQEETKITLVYKSVVDFIKWYNENNQ